MSNHACVAGGKVPRAKALPLSRPTEPFPEAEYRARIDRLRRRMKAERLDAVLLLSPVNRYYFTGFESSAGLCVLQREDAPIFQTDFRYLESARKQMTQVQVVKWGTPAAALGPLAARKKWTRVGHEGSLTVSTMDAWKKAMPDVREWVSIDASLQALRAVKSARELQSVRAAVRANDATFAALLPRIRPGQSEWEIRCMLRALVDQHGQGESFDCIIAAGAHGSICHHHPTTAVLQPRQALLIDMGVCVQRYQSDMTRTVFFGRPHKKMEEIYGIVLEANLAALAAIRPGQTGEAVDAVARDLIGKAGYGKYFDHGLGHGVGLEIHEAPRFSKGALDPLEPGMVLTVEPGIYLPGVGGVRIEDMIVVTRTGCEVLTQTPKELLTLD